MVDPVTIGIGGVAVATAAGIYHYMSGSNEEEEETEFEPPRTTTNPVDKNEHYKTSVENIHNVNDPTPLPADEDRDVETTEEANDEDVELEYEEESEKSVETGGKNDVVDQVVKENEIPDDEIHATGNVDYSNGDLTTIAYIGDDRAATLEENGYESVRDVQRATDEDLESLSGFGSHTVEQIRDDLGYMEA